MTLKSTIAATLISAAAAPETVSRHIELSGPLSHEKPSDASDSTRQSSAAQAIRMRHVSEVLAFPTQVDWLLKDILERGVIGVLAGPKATLKSFVTLHWALLIATTGKPIVIIAAEGAGLDRRIRAWFKTFAPGVDPNSLPIHVIEHRVDLNQKAKLKLLIAEIESRNIEPALILVDTLSKNSGGLDIDNNTEVKVYLHRLDALRRRYNATILIVAHTGHSEERRPRGAASLVQDTDAEYIVKRRDNTITVTRERFKDGPELEPLAYRPETLP